MSFYLFRGLASRQLQSSPLAWQAPPPVTTFWHLADDFDADGDLDILGCPDYHLPQRFQNRAVLGPGCPGSGGQTPQAAIDPPTLGNRGFGIGLSGAYPGTSAVLAVSLAPAPTTAPCTPGIDLSPGNLILPLGTFGFVTTDPTGAARVPIPLPADPTLQGVTVHFQWGVYDPQGGALRPLTNLALSDSRTIVLW